MGKKDEQGLVGGDEASAPLQPPRPGKVTCPQCGSVHIARSSRPFVINVVLCAVTCGLSVVACIVAFGAAIALAALPVTAAMAILGSDRCRDCGYHLGVSPGGGEPASLRPFPWMLHVLNALLLFVLCVIGPQVLRNAAGAAEPLDVMGTAGMLFTYSLFAWASLAWHSIAYRRLKRWVVSPVIWTVIFLLPGIVGGGWITYRWLPRVRVQRLLSYAELAPLPDSAMGIKVSSWASPFSGEDFLCFTAEPNDIARFLAESPALRGQQPTRYSAERTRLLQTPEFEPEDWDSSQEYVLPHSSSPGWYKQEVTGRARKYDIQPPQDQLPGEVLVDDETNTVYVRMCFS